MAFGHLKLGEYFWEMEFCEFVNAWKGYIEAKKQDYAVSFEMARFISISSSFSSKQQKAVIKAKNPYTEHKPKGRPVTMGEISGLLSAMTKN